MTTRPICITLLASEWASSKGGLSTMNRELAIQLAKLSNTSVSFFVPKCSDENKREASNYKVNIVTAEERPGFAPIDWLTFPPENLDIDFVVGHGVILGKQAQIIRNSHQCKWVQVVHTAPDELAVYKEYSGAISKGDEKQSAELKLCKMADLVVAIGPKLTEFYAALLNFCGKKVYNFTPGIFNEFASLNVSSMKGKRFRILVFGRGDTEDFKLKGYDIAAKAVAKLVDKTYHLTFVGASKGSESDVTKEMLKHDLLQSQLIVKGYLENREDLLTLLCASNLVIIPSRTEGFGLTALEALSAGIPFLVSQNSGFGEALQEIPRGSAFIVDSEDPENWAEAIEATRQKGSDTAFQECQELRALYAEKYKWEKQSEELLRTMKLLINEDNPGKTRQTSTEYQLPKKNFGQNVSTPTPKTEAESPNPAKPELHTSLLKIPDRKKSDERPSEGVPEEITAAQIRPTSQGARPKQRNSTATESAHEVTVVQAPADLAIIGCSVSEGSIAQLQAIESIGHAHPLVKNFSTAKQAKLYLERHSLQYCVLVVDGETVKDAYENLPTRKVEYEDLFKTAVERVAIKVVVFVCGSVSLPKNDEEIIFQTINRAVMEKNKGFVAWLKNGRLTVGTDVLVQLLNPAQVMSFGMPPSALGQTNIPLHSFCRRRHLEQPPERKPGYGWENKKLQQQRESFPVTIPTDNTKQNCLIGKLVLESKVRYGRISFEPADLKFLSEEFQEIPEDIIQHLLQTNRRVQERSVKIMLVPSHNRHIVYIGDQGIDMADNDLLLLKTRICNGMVSLHEDDIEVRYPVDWEVPTYILEDLKKKGSNGRLFIISNEKGNLRCHIKLENMGRVAGAKNKALAFLTSIMPT